MPMTACRGGGRMQQRTSSSAHEPPGGRAAAAASRKLLGTDVVELRGVKANSLHAMAIGGHRAVITAPPQPIDRCTVIVSPRSSADRFARVGNPHTYDHRAGGRDTTMRTADLSVFSV